jgi:predicted O-methyltransferase YrrM
MTDILIYDTQKAAFGLGQQPPNYECSGQAIIDLVKPFRMSRIIGLEIGTDIGQTARYLLKTEPRLFLYCVDPYSNYIDWNGNNLNDRDIIHDQFVQQSKEYEDRYMLYRKSSNDAVSLFLNESLDFVFIDGLHVFEQTYLDCFNYYSKVKKGGLFCGHDYNTIRGVNMAVNKFASEVGATVKTAINDVWYWYKE